MNNKRLVSEFLQNTCSPPVMQARRWLEDKKINENLNLMNLSQAAPMEAPPDALIEHIKGSLNSLSSHTYGPVLGIDELRSEIGMKWSGEYKAHISSKNVAITSGCNQAFCTAISIIAKPGDKIILPVPWYFNHKMWLDIQGIEVVPLPCTDNLEPDIDKLNQINCEKVKALVLVSPNNPTGKEYSETLLEKCAEYVKNKNIFLILDETYKDFRSSNGPPHNLFKIGDWEEWFIHLYSFSKSYRLTGHRVGMMICGSAFLSEAEKFLDTMSICPNPIGQQAALFGLQNLGQFLSEERIKILEKQKYLMTEFTNITDWDLLSSGAYFAYLKFNGINTSQQVIEKLISEGSMLILPGTMFGPDKNQMLEQTFRVAFANIELNGIKEFVDRFRKISWY